MKEGSILVMHWGRTGGGPRFTSRMAEAIQAEWSGNTYVSMHAEAIDAQLGTPRIWSVQTYKSRLGLLNLPRLARLAIQTRQRIRRHDVRVVYSGMLSIWQSLALRVTLPADVIYIASIHDATEHPGDEHWLLRLCRWCELRRADMIVTYSDDTARRLIRQIEDPSRIITTHHGVDAPRIGSREAPRDTEWVVAFVGRIVEYKGIDLFVECIRELRDRGHAVRGRVAGNGTPEKQLVATSQDIVDWDIRWYSEEELNSAVSSSDIVLLPYREASQSGVYTLAICMGVPTVVTPVGGLADQVRSAGSGVIAEAVSAEALADAVETLFDRELYEINSASGISAALDGALSWRAAARSIVTRLAEQRPDEHRS